VVKALRDENAALVARVQQQVQELAVANRDLEAFSASVSHDLRAPVAAIEGFATVLIERHANQLDARGLGYLERIGVAVRHMNDLIDGLLRLAHVARQPLEFRPVDLAQLAAAVVRDLAAGGQLQEAWIIVQALPGAHGDAALLRQLLANLLSNAGKFSAKQPLPSVVLGARTQEGEVAYYVRDNGAGFDMAFAQNLFEPFQRLHRAEEFAGLGIGLSIVQRIVHRHGGRIWAEGEVGRGACFYFTLG
jgi:light-regulated signal transduction histidine kinase (bacteriophytochrome)